MIVGTSKKHLVEVVLTSTHNLCFGENITKIGIPIYKSELLINLLVYSTYMEILVSVILVTFLFSYSLYWISPRPNTADLALIRLTSLITL